MATQNPTSNYNWTLPTVGGSADAWGTILNAIIGDDVTGIDAVVKAVSDVANAALPKAGGTVTGEVTFNVTPRTNAIAERTSGSGVTVDGLLIKDGAIPASGVPSLDASKIGSGTLDDARLSANVPRLASTNVFTALQTVERSAGTGGFGARAPGDTNSRVVMATDGSIAAGGTGTAAAPVVITSARVLQNVTMDASLVTGGTFADARIPSTIPRLGSENLFTAAQTVDLNSFPHLRVRRSGATGEGRWVLGALADGAVTIRPRDSNWDAVNDGLTITRTGAATFVGTVTASSFIKSS